MPKAYKPKKKKTNCENKQKKKSNKIVFKLGLHVCEKNCKQNSNSDDLAFHRGDAECHIKWNILRRINQTECQQENQQNQKEQWTSTTKTTAVKTKSKTTSGH